MPLPPCPTRTPCWGVPGTHFDGRWFWSQQGNNGTSWAIDTKLGLHWIAPTAELLFRLLDRDDNNAGHISAVGFGDAGGIIRVLTDKQVKDESRRLKRFVCCCAFCSHHWESKKCRSTGTPTKR